MDEEEGIIVADNDIVKSKEGKAGEYGERGL